VPVGGLGLPDGTNATIRADADVQIMVNDNGSYYVAINNADPSNDEATHLFGELAGELGIAKIEQLASIALAQVPAIVFHAVGLVASVIASVFTTSHLTQERCLFAARLIWAPLLTGHP
jgi:hypothetical protein